MRVEGQAARDPPDVLQLSIATNPLAVRHALQEAMLWASTYLRSEEARGAAEIVLAEVLNNIVEHAYAGESTAGLRKAALKTRISVGRSGANQARHSGSDLLLTLVPSMTGLICLVEDGGLAMRGRLPAATAPPDPATLPEGGFGWLLIRALCQDLHYERAAGRNRLRFIIPERQSGECDAIV